MAQTRNVAERDRLAEDDRRQANWKRWGPYLSERQWGTVREDYSADGAMAAPDNDGDANLAFYRAYASGDFEAEFEF